MSDFNSITGQGTRAPAYDSGTSPTEQDPTEPIPGAPRSVDIIDPITPDEMGDPAWVGQAPEWEQTETVTGGGGAAPPGFQPVPPGHATVPTSTTSSGGAPAPPIVSGLGKEVDQILNKSPYLRAVWEKAKANGWHIKISTAVHSQAVAETKTVFVNLKDVSTQGADRARHVASLLAHEIGHAGTPYPPIMRGRDVDEYVRLNTEWALRHEGAAALANLKAREEILASGGPDILVRGGLDDFYIGIYNEMKPPQNLGREEAIGQLAQFMAGEPQFEDGTTKEQFLQMFFRDRWAKENKKK